VTKLLYRVVTVDWPKAAQDGGKAFLLKTARNGHQKIMSDAKTKGLEPYWEAYANRPGNSNLETVVLPGPIVYNYRYLSDLIQYALDELRKQSPIDSGKYKNSHTVYVNGSPVGNTVPKNIQPGDQIMIANPVPYARRLEVGRARHGARPFLISVPNRIYERVVDMVKAHGKGRSKVRMAYVDLGAWTLRQDQKTLIKTPRGYGYSKRQRPDRVAGSVVKSPAIFFTAPI
jgi:hypothetical protein